MNKAKRAILKLISWLICPISNIMQFKDFDEREKQEKTSKLFNIPKRFALNYENALVVARSHKSDN